MVKEYIGDSVYVEMDEFGSLVLTTDNGERATNTILLEPAVMESLIAFYKRAKK